MFYLFYRLRNTPTSSNNHQEELAKKKLKSNLLKSDSFVYKENIDEQELNTEKHAEEDFQEAMNIIEEYQNIIKTNKKNIIRFPYQQGIVLKKLTKIENLKVLLNNLK